jgi:hypothetical protein
MALRRKSRGEVSNAASRSAGATNSASASSGSIRICGANGRKARPTPAIASRDGALLLSGDALHFKDNWENRRVPDINFDKEQTAASCSAWPRVLAKEKAQLWINHDKTQRDSLKMAPGFYD